MKKSRCHFFYNRKAFPVESLPFNFVYTSKQRMYIFDIIARMGWLTRNMSRLFARTEEYIGSWDGMSLECCEGFFSSRKKFFCFLVYNIPRQLEVSLGGIHIEKNKEICWYFWYMKKRFEWIMWNTHKILSSYETRDAFSPCENELMKECLLIEWKYRVILISKWVGEKIWFHTIF